MLAKPLDPGAGGKEDLSHLVPGLQDLAPTGLQAFVIEAEHAFEKWPVDGTETGAEHSFTPGKRQAVGAEERLLRSLAADELQRTRLSVELRAPIRRAEGS